MMRLRFNWVLVSLVLVIACAYGWTALGQRQATASSQWEYTIKHTSSPFEQTPAAFNELGAQGWELVNVTEEGWAYFKRPKK